MKLLPAVQDLSRDAIYFKVWPDAPKILAPYLLYRTSTIWLMPFTSVEGATHEQLSDLVRWAAWGRPLAAQTLHTWLDLPELVLRGCTTRRARMEGVHELLLAGRVPAGGGGGVRLLKVGDKAWDYDLLGVYADSVGAAKRFLRGVNLTFRATVQFKKCGLHPRDAFGF